MAALWNRAGHYILVLWFLLLSSFFLLSPRLISAVEDGRLHVYHTSTHGVALVRIWDAGLKCAARGSLEIQNATRMWANTQRDGRTAEYKWRPLFNAAKFG